MGRAPRLVFIALVIGLLIAATVLTFAPRERAALAQVFPLATATRTPTPINVGNFVWDDLDHDGRQDAGEPGLAGITVQLWNSSKTQLIDSAVTNASGIYSLTAPTPGQYRVRVLLPGALDSFSPKDNAAAGDQLDSDINTTGVNLGFTDVYDFASNLISITSIDAGIIRFFTPTPTRTPTPISVGNFVWNDLDHDGRQDAGEPGIAGVTVQLWNSTKTQLIDSAVTNASGIYSLTAPTPGEYRVRVLLPNVSDSFSPIDQASGDDQLDSDINPTGTNFGFTNILNFASNLISITSIDAGIIPFVTPTPTRTPTPINVGNFIWDDLDQDGRQDAGEPGIAGVTVQLWNSDKTQLIDSAVTNALGIYSLTAPAPGSYRVRVLLPDLLDQFNIKDNAAAGDQLDSDINSTGINLGFTDIYTFASNLISITSIDAGIISFNTPTPTRTPTPISLGNFVWNDVNANGIQDGGEPGLVGVTVELWTADKSAIVDVTTTGPSGTYTLVAPTPGQYRIRVLLLASGEQFSPKDVGSDLDDSDINPSGVNFGFTDVINIASNVISISSIDAGIVNVQPTLTPTDTPESTFTPTDTPTLDPSITPTASLTPSYTHTATDTPDPAFTATFTPTDDPLDIYTDTPTIDPLEPTVQVGTETPTPDEPTLEFFTETPEGTDEGVAVYTDTPLPSATAPFPTPPGTPRCDLRVAEPGDIVRAGVRPEFDLYCRVLIQWSDLVYYYGYAVTNYGNVGIDALIQLGIIHAVDIFSPSGQTYFNGGYVMCLAGEGTLIWLDANNAPRVPAIIGSYTPDDAPGFTCATLFTPGTLVLVEEMDID